MGESISAPERIVKTHDLNQFDCGELSLNDWLIRRALKNELNDASRTYVICVDNVVIGYYSLANGAIDRDAAPRSMQRNMPTAIPVMVLGRLAVDRRFQGQKLGRALLRDAILRVLRAAEIAGITAILVHAISEDAKRFYRRNGFVESDVSPMTLCLLLETARQGRERP